MHRNTAIWHPEGPGTDALMQTPITAQAQSWAMCKTLSRVHPAAHLGSLLVIASLHENVAQAVLDRLIQAWRLHVAHARLHLMRRPQHRLRAHTDAVRQVVCLRCRYPRTLEYLRELCTTACHSSPCIARVKTWPWQCLDN